MLYLRQSFLCALGILFLGEHVLILCYKLFLIFHRLIFLELLISVEVVLKNLQPWHTVLDQTLMWKLRIVCGSGAGESERSRQMATFFARITQGQRASPKYREKNETTICSFQISVAWLRKFTFRKAAKTGLKAFTSKPLSLVVPSFPNKYLLSTHYVPGSVLVIGDTLLNKTHLSALLGLTL